MQHKGQTPHPTPELEGRAVFAAARYDARRQHRQDERNAEEFRGAEV